MPKSPRKKRKKANSQRDWKVLFIWFLVGLSLIQFLIIRSLWRERISLRREIAELKEKGYHRHRLALSKKIRPSRVSKQIHLSKRKKTIKKETVVPAKEYPKVKTAVPLQKKKSVIPARPYLVVVLDDWGYSDRNLDLLRALALPIDVAVFPNHDYTSDVVRLVKKEGKELMIHLPMEPENLPPKNWEKNTITVDMDEETIRRIIDEAVRSVPGAAGVNNHMGSRATADLRVMRIVIKELNKRGLFFLDSVSTPKTVVREVCRELGLPYLARDVFIDNRSDLAYIKGQIRRAVELAKKKGYAVMIGHDRENTLRALIEMETYLRENVEVVKASRLFKEMREGRIR